jgi:conjugal transfer pilus assembly protein TraE
MKTQVRDDAILKNERLVRILTVAVLSEAVAILGLIALCLYSLSVKQTIYQPTLMGQPYTLSAKAVSPNYLKGMATDVMQLRLTFNADTVVARYARLLALVAPDSLSTVRKTLNTEIGVVKSRKLQSVFYQEKVAVDMKTMAVNVTGNLQRIDDGVVLGLVKKTYLLKFNYVHGTLQIVSITEEKTHA